MISTRITRLHVATFAAILIATAATVSAHVVRGLISPTGATAFASSLTSGSDAPVPLRWSSGSVVVDTGLRAACFNVANTSTPRVDRPDWRRRVRPALGGWPASAPARTARDRGA